MTPQEIILSTRFWPETQFSAFFEQAQRNHFFEFGVLPKLLEKFPSEVPDRRLAPKFSHLIWETRSLLEGATEKQISVELQKLQGAVRLAKQKKIPAILLDCFELPSMDGAKRFDHLLRDLQEGKNEALETFAEWKKIREKESDESILALCRLLYPLLKQEPDLQFCLAPRARLYEIPNKSEMQTLFNELKRFPQLRYWHHTAYAYLQEKLNLTPQEEWLALFADQMYGVTLQDAVGYQIGLPPGIGAVSFDFLKDVPEKCIRVLEFSELASWMEMELGLSHLRSYF